MTPFNDDQIGIGVRWQVLAHVLVIKLEQGFLFAKLCQFVVHPVAQLGVALLHGRRDRRFITQLLGKHAITGVLLGPVEQHQVVLGVGIAAAAGQGLQ